MNECPSVDTRNPRTLDPTSRATGTLFNVISARTYQITPSIIPTAPSTIGPTRGEGGIPNRHSLSRPARSPDPARAKRVLGEPPGPASLDTSARRDLKAAANPAQDY